MTRVDPKGILALLFIGLVAGFLAGLLLGGGGFLKYILWGVLGSFIGARLLPMTGWELNTGSLFWDRVIEATLGAIVLVLVARLLS